MRAPRMLKTDYGSRIKFQNQQASKIPQSTSPPPSCNNFNIIMNQMKKDYQHKSITEQKKKRLLKPSLFVNYLPFEEPQKDKVIYAQVAFPQRDQIDIRPVIKKRLLFMLYQILTQYSKAKTPLTNQQKSIFIYLVQNHEIEYLYPLATKMNLQMSSKKFNTIEQSEAAIIEEDVAIDSLHEIEILKVQIENHSQDSSFNELEILDNLSLNEIVSLRQEDLTTFTSPTKRAFHHINSEGQSVEPLIQDLVQYYQDNNRFRQASIADVSRSTIVVNKGNDYQFLSSGSIAQQNLVNSIPIVLQKSKQIREKELICDQNDKIRTNKQPTIPKHIMISRDFDQDILHQISIDEQLDQAYKKKSNLERQGKQGFLQKQKTTPNDRNLLNPSQHRSVVYRKSESQDQDYDRSAINNQNSNLSSVLSSLYNADEDDIQPSAQSIQQIKVSRSIISQGSIQIIKQSVVHSEFGLQDLSPILTRNDIISTPQINLIDANLKIIEQDEEESFHDKSSQNNLMISSHMKKLSTSKFEKEIIKQIPSKQKITTQKLVAINVEVPQRLLFVPPKQYQPSPLIESARTIPTISVSQQKITLSPSVFKKGGLKKLDTFTVSIGKPILDLIKKKKSHLNPVDINQKSPYDKIKLSQHNIQRTQTSEDLMEDEQNSPPISKKSPLKLSVIRRDSLIPKKSTNKELSGEHAKNKELEFLKQYQKQEIERALHSKYASGNSLMDKRNMINDLISQLETEKVPEVKYQIYLYRQRLSQIKNLQKQITDVVDNQLDTLPDCYEYLFNVIDPKFRNKFKSEDENLVKQNTLKFQDNIRSQTSKLLQSQVSMYVNPPSQDQNDYGQQSYKVTDKQNEREWQQKRMIAFLEESVRLKEYRQQEIDDLYIIQSRLGYCGPVETITSKSLKQLTTSMDDIQLKSSLNGFAQKINKNIDSLKKLSKPKFINLNEKFQEIKYVSHIKQALVNRSGGATTIKMTM